MAPIETLRGDPRKPISMEEIAQKFRKCAALSAKPIPEKNVERIIRAFDSLETANDVASVFGMAA